MQIIHMDAQYQRHQEDTHQELIAKCFFFFIKHRWITLLLCFLQTVSPSPPTPPPDPPLPRPNFGVVFHKHPTRLLNGHYIYPLRVMINLDIDLNTTKPDSILELISTSTHPFQAEIAKLTDSLLDLEYSKTQILVESISERINLAETRSKRSSDTHFTADLMRSLFGLATQAEIEALVDQMSVIDVYLAKELHFGRVTAQILANMTDFNFKSLSTLTSFQNDTDSSLFDLENQLNLFGLNITSDLQDLEIKSKINFYNNYLLAAANSRLLSMHEYNRDLQTLEDTLKILDTGILPSRLVKQSTLKDSLYTLAYAMSTSAPGLRVVPVPLQYYYTNKCKLERT